MIPIFLLSILTISFGFSPMSVGLHQAVKVTFTVTNTGDVPVKIDAFEIKIIDPSGKVRLDKKVKESVILYSKDSKEFEVKTGFVVDKVGEWKVVVVVYSGGSPIASASKVFTVEKGEVSVNINDVVGYTIGGLAVAGAIAYALKRKV